MSRYTHRYEALEAGHGRRTTRKTTSSSSRGGGSNTVFYLVLLVVVLAAASLVAVAVAHVASQQAEEGAVKKCSSWDTCNFYKEETPRGLTERAEWNTTLDVELEKIKKAQFFDRLLEYRAARVPVTAHISAPEEGSAAAETPLGKTGLMTGHEYSVLNAQFLKTRKGHELKLVQLRNPHGQVEWKGQWANASKEWELNPEVAAYLSQSGFVPRGDGVFWMEYQQFAKYFTKVTVMGRSMPEIVAKNSRPQNAFYIRAH